MEFALNYSPEAADLVQAGRLEIDYFKCPNWSDIVAQASELRPVNIHFPLKIGRGVGDAWNGELNQPVDWGMVEHFLSVTATPYVNLHLSIPHPNPKIAIDDLSQSAFDLALETVMGDLMPVIRRFGAERLIIENETQNHQHNTHISVVPQFIAQVVRESQCGFLFDLAHAELAAREWGIDPQVYVQELPLAHIREIHVAGIQYLDQAWIDRITTYSQTLSEQRPLFPLHVNSWMDHLPLVEENWPFITWALNQVHEGAWSSPWITSLEYGGVGGFFGAVTTYESLENDVPRLYQQVKPKISSK